MPNLTNPTFLYELSLGLFRALARGGGRCHAYSFMVLEDMMQTGIAWSLLSNRKRTFSQLLRIYFTKKISNRNSNSVSKPNPETILLTFHFTQAPSFPNVLESHGAKNPNAETFSQVFKCNFLGMTKQLGLCVQLQFLTIPPSLIYAGLH